MLKGSTQDQEIASREFFLLKRNWELLRVTKKKSWYFQCGIWFHNIKREITSVTYILCSTLHCWSIKVKYLMQLWTLHIKSSKKSRQNISKQDCDAETLFWLSWWCRAFQIGITDTWYVSGRGPYDPLSCPIPNSLVLC